MVSRWRSAVKSVQVLLNSQWRQLRRQLALIARQFMHARYACPHHIPWDWSSQRYNRVALINALVASRPQCRYLEIGCDQNEVLDAIPLPLTQKIGVDPHRGGTHRMTSDAFFAGLPQDERFDVIFIDGDHTYEQLRRDVMNAMAHVSPGGWIVLHDMLPTHWLEAHQPRLSDVWTGDCWKVGFELMQTPGIEWRMVTIDHGMALLRRTAEHTMLADQREHLREQSFAYFYEHRHELPLVSWDEALIWIHATNRVSAEPLQPVSLADC